MEVIAGFFYLFAVLAIASGLMVVLTKNPVHAVLFLILTFFNGAGLFVLLGAEFLAMVLVIVYVGAVAVLFLFVVMMLDVDFAQLKAGFIKNAPVGVLVGGVVLVELLLLFLVRGFHVSLAETPGVAVSGEVHNTYALGQILYTKYAHFFEVAGLILLVAMIGAIVLTVRHKEGVKRQSISAQVNRNPSTSVELVKVAPGGAVIPSGDNAS